MHLKSRYRPKRYASGGAVAPDIAAVNAASLRLDDHVKQIQRQQEVRDQIERAAAPAEPVQQPEPVELPPRAMDWLRANPEYLQNESKNNRLQALHWVLVGEGYEGFSEPYFAEVDRRLGHGPDEGAVQRALDEARSKAPSVPADEDDDEPIVNARWIYSAPPTREVPGSNGVRPLFGFQDNPFTRTKRSGPDRRYIRSFLCRTAYQAEVA